MFVQTENTHFLLNQLFNKTIIGQDKPSAYSIEHIAYKLYLGY